MQTLDYITERDTYDKFHKVVILRPFKVLAVNADKIRDHLKFLEEMHSPSADQSKKNSDDPGQDTAQSEPTPAWETHEALVHLRLLVQFMDEDLNPIWEIQKGLKEGTLKGVHFADLWHVFERGALICTPGPRVQV